LIIEDEELDHSLENITDSSENLSIKKVAEKNNYNLLEK